MQSSSKAPPDLVEPYRMTDEGGVIQSPLVSQFPCSVGTVCRIDEVLFIESSSLLSDKRNAWAEELLQQLLQCGAAAETWVL